ncbi:MAG: Ig domain-containing protein, partial [Planctomycetes bacterium]|nr:Ig domain-containing protein [Planctomycetota bacterium]
MVKSLYCLSLVVLTTMLCGSISAQIYPLGQQNAGTGAGFQGGFLSGNERQRGWRFKVNIAGVRVSRLGCDYPNGDVTVTLFEVAAPQAIVAQVFCPQGWGWQWTGLAAPVTLQKGSEYIIVGHSTNATRYQYGSRSQLAATWFPGGDINYIEGRFSIPTTTSSTFPTGISPNMQQGVVDFGYTVHLGVATAGKLPDAGEGGAYDEYISAENGTPSYTWSLTSGALPNGLNLVQSADEFQLVGTPAAGTEGTYTFGVTVTDSATNTATATKAMELYVHDITIETPARLPDGIEGTAYLEDIQAAYGTAPFTWFLTSGTLPSGLTLVQNGDNYRLSGTVAANSSDYYTFEVTVTDSATVPVTDTKTMTLLVVLPDSSYTYPMGRQDPTTSGFFPETVANLQFGWKFKVNGVGVNLTKLGCNVPSGPVTVTLFDAATRAIMAQVICGPGAGWQFTNLTSPIALIPDKEYVIAGYTVDACYLGSILPVAWTPTGVIEHKENLWTTSASGPGVFPPATVLPAWHLGLVDFGYTRDLSVATPASLPNGAEQSFYSTNIQADFGTPPYNWTHASGTLPTGLTLAQASNKFQLSGTPASGAAGNYTFDVTVTDSATFPATSTKTVTVLIVPPPATLPFFDDFSTDKGWQYETSWRYGTEWTRGVTQGYTATSPDRSEPTYDNTPSSTDNFIAGHKIGLDYERDMESTVWLTSPPVDCTGVASVSLRYFRWMGVSIGDTALIEISGDGGATWDEVWTSIPAAGGPQSNISDSNWLFVTHDISTWVANSSSKVMQVRFGIGPTDATPHTGWCLDDVHIVETGPDFEVREGGLTGTLLSDNEAVGGLR